MILPDGTVGQANFRFSGVGAPTGAEVTYGFLVGAGAPILAPDIAESFRDVWTTTIRTVQHNSVTLDEVYVKIGPNATGPDGTFAVGTSGALGGGGAAANLAILVRKLTAAGGKRGRGRMYWPGVPEDYVDAAGVLSSGALAAWQTQATAFFDGLEDLFLFGRLLHSPGISVVPAPTPLVGLAVQPIAGTQRQRMRR